jgi:hypothetical protein
VPDPAGVPEPDPQCRALVEVATVACPERGSARAALAEALTLTNPAERDARLACLETESEFTPGLLRALRAELSPPQCADVLSTPFLEPRRADLDRRVEDVLIALAAAGKLARLVQQAPELSAPFDREHFRDFFQSTLKPWIVRQAQAIHALSAVGPTLSPYAKGVVAIEAGLADMRFVSVVRRVALPKEMQDDPEVRDAYYAALDEALEPRKTRGRDAALVGLNELSQAGVLIDERVERARTLLSEIYSGRRIDALDKLLLPAEIKATLDTTDRKLAARLPTFYAGFILAEAPLDNPLLRALMERGLPPALVKRLDPEQLDDAGKDLFVRALLERGRRYWRAEDFAQATRLSAEGPRTPTRAFYHALGSALLNGPRDASDLLLRAAFLPGGGGQIAELDRLAFQKDELAPLAAFDAAYLLGMIPPQNDPKFWDALGKRFERAARSLRSASQKTVARDFGRAAKDTAKALRAAPAARN